MGSASVDAKTDMATRSIKCSLPEIKWVVYLARSNKFIGLNFQNSHRVGFSLVEFPHARLFAVEQGAMDFLEYLRETKNLRKLSAKQLRRLRVRCVTVTLDIKLRRKSSE